MTSCVCVCVQSYRSVILMLILHKELGSAWDEIHLSNNESDSSDGYSISLPLSILLLLFLSCFFFYLSMIFMSLLHLLSKWVNEAVNTYTLTHAHTTPSWSWWEYSHAQTLAHTNSKTQTLTVYFVPTTQHNHTPTTKNKREERNWQVWQQGVVTH